MSHRSPRRISVLAIHSVMFVLLGCAGLNPALAKTAASIKITSPARSSVVSGTVTIVTQEEAPISWMNAFVDQQWFVSDGAAKPYSVQWNSTTVPNGQHTLTVIGYNDLNQPLAQYSVVVSVANTTRSPSSTPTIAPTPSKTPTATPTAVPSPTATVTPHPSASPSPTSTPTPPTHLGNVPPGGAIPDETICTTLANQSNFPETTPSNVDDGSPVHWDSNNPMFITPFYYYQHAGEHTAIPNSALQNVDGNYTGSTQDILRWAACKHGVDEDWVYAESYEEDGWFQDCAQMHGGTGCNVGGDCGNPDASQVSGATIANLSFLGFSVTDSAGKFIGTNGLNGANHNGQVCSSNYASYSLIQNKVQYAEWYTWPMVELSTAWGSDYRWAKYQACVAGTFAFNNSDYTNAVSRATSHPNAAVPSGQLGPSTYFSGETNMQYLALGCIGTHYSGDWYDSGAQNYIGTFVNNYLNPSNWPGNRK
jgi:hypothetical protein